MQDISSVIVTASSHGLGYSIAERFSDSHRVIINGRNPDMVLKAKNSIKNVADVVVGDIRDPLVVADIKEKMIKHNTTIMINNAAIPCYGIKLENMTSDQIENSLSTNLVAQITLSKAFYETAKGRSANSGIININSIVGIEPKEHRSVHSATKWGLRGFSKSLRIEAEKDGFKVMNVYPTRIKLTPECSFGMETDYVANLIYEGFMKVPYEEELVIDGRPEQFRPKEKYDA